MIFFLLFSLIFFSFLFCSFFILELRRSMGRSSFPISLMRDLYLLGESFFFIMSLFFPCILLLLLGILVVISISLEVFWEREKNLRRAFYDLANFTLHRKVFRPEAIIIYFPFTFSRHFSMETVNYWTSFKTFFSMIF